MTFPSTHCRLLLLILLAFFLFCGSALSAEELKVNTSIKPPFSTSEEDGFFDLILKELGRRTGVRVRLVRQPPERALLSANQGVSDMELPRIAGLEKTYTNLVMVPEKVIDYNFVAFTRSRRGITDWQDLAGRNVGYLLGWKIFENNVPKSASVTKLKTPSQLMAMLAEGRIDVALYESYAGREIVRRQQLASIVESPQPLAVKPMYMYVHKSNAYFASILDMHLKRMKLDGTYRRIEKMTLNAP